MVYSLIRATLEGFCIVQWEEKLRRCLQCPRWGVACAMKWATVEALEPLRVKRPPELGSLRGTLVANYHTRTLENKQLAHSHFGKDASLRKISYVSCSLLYGGYSMTSNGSYWFFVSVYFPKSAPALPSGNGRGGGLGEGWNPSPIRRAFSESTVMNLQWLLVTVTTTMLR